MRALLAMLLLLPLPAARAQTVLAALKAGQWAQADALAAQQPDPLARLLVLYSRLLTPGAAHAAEIAAFMSAHPDWPNQALLSRRLQEALAIDKDDRAVAEICRQRPPQAVPSMLRCAEASGAQDAPASPDSPVRRAWITGITDAPSEAAFLRRWSAQITPEDQWRRFDRLAWSEPMPPPPNTAAARQATRLPPAMRPLAEARLALRRDVPTAPALVAALPDPARADPALVYELARWYRRAGLDHDAAAIWSGAGVAAEQAAPPERRNAFWDERNLLARRLLRAAEPDLAYATVANPAASPDGAIDSAFLAGWIALRRLNQPETALKHFTTLAGLSGAVITQARAHYWLGRAHQAASAQEDARAEYARAAAFPTTYYGQVAALALGDDAMALRSRIAAAADPVWTDAGAEAFLANDAARAAVLLTAWGEPRRAKPFLDRLDELATSPVQRALAARLALGLGLPEEAVAIARRAGRDGTMLPGAGWPTSVHPLPGPVEPALVLALIRQESSFDSGALSPAGARGLMQLMPATAAAVAKRLGVPADVGALTSDPAYNIRLGTTFLQGLLTQFGQTMPLAIAGYNAGPSRVVDWLGATGAAPGDPTGPGNGTDMIDWIELIPFNETRNYVQRVIENTVIYRAQLNALLPHPIERQPDGRSG